MKKFVALLTKGKQLKINGKMVTQTFFELYKSKNNGLNIFTNTMYMRTSPLIKL